jgi:neogenin
VRKYLLKYGIGYPETEVEIAGNRNSHIISNLVPASPYVVSLRAVNNAGYGMEILKDVITKRRSTLSETDTLFPPLNVQAVGMSPYSVEVRWTDWHLKPDEAIADERYYLVRYNVADTYNNPKYKYKNATERSVIVSDLRPNTLYDFAVKLVIGKRESDWSMTTSQMSMELSPAPRDIQIKNEANSATSVVLSWLAPTTVSSQAPG